MGTRKAVNLTIDAELLSEARAHELNLSQLLDESLRARLKTMRAERWLEENREAIRISNEDIDKNGLWCDAYRLF